MKQAILAKSNVWKKAQFLHAGKGKSIYAVKDHPALVWLEFNDTLTAFNGQKKSSFKGKGGINRDISSALFRFLSKEKIKNHYVEDVGSAGMICHQLKILPLEVVVRNRLTGSTARRFQFSEGTSLSAPLTELYYKNDELGDPFVSTEQALAFGFVSKLADVEMLKKIALQVNKKLKQIFDSLGLELIDFKLEFGSPSPSSSLFNQAEKFSKKKPFFFLGDEISCDSCRLWDKKTGKKMDKDRFRLNLGGVEESYKKVRNLLQILAKA